MLDINKIYEKYFELIDSFFGGIKHHLGTEEDSHIDLGIKMASYPLISDLILDSIGDIEEEIEKFWRENALTAFSFLKEQQSLKCLYSGDISPVILGNFAKRSSLYIDTVILPDPLYNLTIFQKQITTDKKYYLNKLIRHVFNIWRLKDLILSNINPRIIAILPISLMLVDNPKRNELLNTADNKFKDYINKLFDKGLNSKDECFEFLEKYRSANDIHVAVKNPNLLPNLFKNLPDLEKHLSSFSDVSKFIQTKSSTPGWEFALYVNSQFIRVQEHRYFCENLIAEPIYDYELPWFFFNYEFGGLDMDAAISNSLQMENFNWIGNSKIPLSVFQKLREENKLEYMRNVLRQGMTDLKAKKDADLIKTSEQIEINFKEAFRQQDLEIDSLKNEVAKIAKKELPITVGGFLAGFIPYLSNIISFVSAGRDVKNLIAKRKDLQEKIEDKKTSLINLLMTSHE